MNTHLFHFATASQQKGKSPRLRAIRAIKCTVAILLLLTITSYVPYSHTQAAPVLDRSASLTSPLQADQNLNLTILGSMSGLVSDVEVQGDYAFAGFGPKLVVIDISNPDKLNQVASLSLTTSIDDIELSPPYLVALSENTGLTVIDISNPLEPRQAGYYSQRWDATGLAVAVDYAYVTKTRGSLEAIGGIEIIDLSDPLHPTQVGIYYPYTIALDIQISNDFAYVVGSGWDPNGEDGIKVLNITNPQLPEEVGSLLSSTDYIVMASMSIDNAYLYLMTSNANTGINDLQILDISAATTPVLIGSYPMPTFVGLDIALDGEYAYLVGYNGFDGFCFDICQGGLLVLNITDPAHPSEIGMDISPGIANNMALAGNRLLLTRQKYSTPEPHGGELQSIDISNPAAPALVSTLISPLNRPGSIVVDGNVAYIADQSVRATDSALRVVDTSSLKGPILLGSFEVQGDINDLAVVGDNVYLAELPRQDASYQNTIGGGFRILDVSNPQTPVEAYFYNDSAWQFLALDVQDNYAYLIGQELCPENYDCHIRLWILDVTNPGDPQELGLYDLNGYEIDPACDVVVQGSYAYLALRHNGLWILDISDPAYPSLVSSYQTDDAVDLDVAGDYAYIADSLSGVSIINVQNPANPIEITRLSSISAQHIEIAGDKLYVTGGGLRVFDVTDPASPIELANFPSGSHSAVADDIVYLTSDPEGLFLLSLSSWIKGTVLHPNRMPAVGVSISADDIISTTTTTDGIYLLDDLEEGDYTIVPSYPGYTFSPTQLQVNLPPSVIANFTMLPTPVSIALSPGITTTLSYTDTQGLPTSLLFPVGAISTDTLVVLTPTISTDLAGYAFTGHAFDLAAYQVGVKVPDLTFSVPVSVTIHYSQEDIALITDGTSLRLWWWDGYSWQDAEQICQPPEGLSAKSREGIYEGVLCRTGLFSLMGQTRSLFLPVISN